MQTIKITYHVVSGMGKGLDTTCRVQLADFESVSAGSHGIFPGEPEAVDQTPGCIEYARLAQW